MDNCVHLSMSKETLVWPFDGLIYFSSMLENTPERGLRDMGTLYLPLQALYQVLLIPWGLAGSASFPGSALSVARTGTDRK